jgi:hypothetical protein
MSLDGWEKFKAALSGARKWFGWGAVLGLVAAVFVLGGRAGWYLSSPIEAEPLSTSSSPSGIVYFLPRTIVAVDLQYQILRCDLEQVNQTKETSVVVEAEITALLTEQLEADPTKAYLIKSDAFYASLWQTELIVDISNGLLKSITSKNVSEIEIPKSADPTKILTRIVAASPYTPQTANNADALETARRRVCGLLLVAAIERYKKSQTAADLPKIQRTLRFDPTAQCPLDTNKPTEAQSSVFLCRLNGKIALGAVFGEPDVIEDTLNRYTVDIRVAIPPATTAKMTGSGIAYRMPVTAQVQVCSPRCGGGGRVLGERVSIFPQLGATAFASVERRLFSDQSIQLEFGPFGELKRAKYLSSKTPMETSQKREGVEKPERPLRPDAPGKQHASESTVSAETSGTVSKSAEPKEKSE